MNGTVVPFVRRCQPVEAATLQVRGLAALCDMAPDGEVASWILKFHYGAAIVTIRVVFDDRQTGADMVVTHMTTLPEEERGRRVGARALTALLSWAADCGLRDIRAVQVQGPSERFWLRNGFRPERNPTNDFRYEGRLSAEMAPSLAR